MGHGVGSPRYMAPEQIETPDRVDHRTDVWGLGVLGYEMLTGVAPFEGKGIADICARVVRTSHAPIRALRPDVWPDLERFLEICLQKNPRDRFRTMDEARAALLAAVDPAPALASATLDVDDEPTRPIPIPGLERRIWPRAALALALAGACGWVAWMSPRALCAYLARPEVATREVMARAPAELGPSAMVPALGQAEREWGVFEKREAVAIIVRAPEPEMR